MAIRAPERAPNLPRRNTARPRTPKGRPLATRRHPFGIRHRGKGKTITHLIKGRKIQERIQIEDAHYGPDGKPVIVISRTNLETGIKKERRVTQAQYKEILKIVQGNGVIRQGKRMTATALAEHGLLTIAHVVFGI